MRNVPTGNHSKDVSRRRPVNRTAKTAVIVSLLGVALFAGIWFVLPMFGDRGNTLQLKRIVPSIPISYVDFALSLAGIATIVGGVLGVLALRGLGIRIGAESGKALAILSIMLALPATAVFGLMALIVLVSLRFGAES